MSSTLPAKVIFLHAGFRSGGTALAFSFRQLEDFKLYYDPFNLNIEAMNQYLDRKYFLTTNWQSNHPGQSRYFLEYRDLIDSKPDLLTKINIPNLRYDYWGENYAPEAIDYLNQIIDFCGKINQNPVFKFETLTGRIPLLKQHFENAIQIGIVRNFDEQLFSFLEQMVYNNTFFFDEIICLMQTNIEFFKIEQEALEFRPDIEHRKYLFAAFETGRRKLLVQADYILETTDEKSFKESLSNIPDEVFSEKDKLDILKYLTEDATRQKILIEKNKKLIKNNLRIVENLRQAEKTLQNFERELKSKAMQLEAFQNSRIWRYTAPLRKIKNIFKIYAEREK